MLILSRKIGEAIVLDEKVTVRVIEVSKGVVKLGFDAPNDMLILREELEEEIKKANQQANQEVDTDTLTSLSQKISKK
jgi:carbon storage regulator